MRWFWIDRFTEFVQGRRARAVKAVTLAEEQAHDHFPGAAMMPATLIIEGMAQTAGLLVADTLGFRRQVVLAKVGGARFEFEVVPGDTIEFFADIVELTEDGSVVRVTSSVAGRPHGSADLYYGHLEAGTASGRARRLFFKALRPARRAYEYVALEERTRLAELAGAVDRLERLDRGGRPDGTDTP
jgi:3-hydroxyacyl-[acyl-carrier-protein] dehydratase